jgi:outer membrane receptor protein involved in Fe transport
LTKRSWYRSASVLVVLLGAQVAGAAHPDGGGGGVLGWVEDTRGTPVAGAVISIFGKGVGGSGLVTLSDSAGRFFLPSLPAGSYTLRALGVGHLPAPARLITVLPNRDSTFTVSLTPIGDPDDASAQAEPRNDQLTRRELTWLLRHKRRSVLETRSDAPAEGEGDAPPEKRRLLASFLPDLTGSVELVTNPAEFGDDGGGEDEPASLSVLRLRGRIAQSGSWSLGGVVSESESTIWRMAAEFLIDSAEGHELQAGSGYGARWRRPVLPSEQASRLDDRSVGALFLQDRMVLDERLAATLGGRFTHIGFLADANHFDPLFALELRTDERTRLRASVASRTLVPGGDLLTLSSLATAPAIAYAVMDVGLRPERSRRTELALEQDLGPAGETRLRAYAFYEGVQDQLHNGFEGTGPGRTLTIANVGRVSARGMGLSVARRIGESISGSMTYTYGHSWRPSEPSRERVERITAIGVGEGDFHDLVARVETVLDGTDTRLAAYYRLSRLVPAGESREAAIGTSRFDVQLSQGLPFLGDLTGADWDLLVAVRNLYYEPSEGALLDEMAVANPPKRVLGGIAVRF